MPRSICITGGVGDFFALESLMTDAERSSLGTIYWATRAANPMVKLLRQSGTYRDVEHVVYPIGGEVHFDLASVRGAIKTAAYVPFPDDAEDWSVTKRFGEIKTRAYNPSTFLTEEPADTRHFELPPKYVLCHDQTTMHANAAQRAARDLDGDEWNAVLEHLEREDKHLVLVNTPDSEPRPRHDRVTDLVGKTTLRETVALLRDAEGYWGIASAWCVLAAQLFDAADLWVKGVEPWLWTNRHIYFQPHQQYPFLFKRLTDSDPWTVHNHMKTIMFKCVRIVDNAFVGPGSLVDLPPDQAAQFVANGQAEYFDPAQLRTATAPLKTRKATKYTEG